MKDNIKYKLTDNEGYTRRGREGQTRWLDGIEHTAKGNGKNLCSKDVIHYYDNPNLAVLYNVIHANIENPHLIVLEIDKCVAHDGLKGGCKKARFVEECLLPYWSIFERVEFAIKISLTVYKNKNYIKWAKNWLNGKDRTIQSIDEITAEINIENNSVKTVTAECAIDSATYAINAASDTWVVASFEGVAAKCAVERIIKNVAEAAVAVCNAEIKRVAGNDKVGAKRFLQSSLNIITQIKKGQID